MCDASIFKSWALSRCSSKAYPSAQAKADADQQLAKARDTLRAQVADLAVKGAEQILKREVNASAHADLLSRLSVEL